MYLMQVLLQFSELGFVFLIDHHRDHRTTHQINVRDVYVRIYMLLLEARAEA